MATPDALEEFRSAARSMLDYLHRHHPDLPPPAKDSKPPQDNHLQEALSNHPHLDRHASFRFAPEVNNLNHTVASMCSTRRFPDVSEAYLQLTMESTGICDSQSATRVMLVRDEILKLKEERGLTTTAAVQKLTERIRRSVAKKQSSPSSDNTVNSSSSAAGPSTSSKKRKHGATELSSDGEDTEPPVKRRKTKDKSKSRKPIGEPGSGPSPALFAPPPSLAASSVSTGPQSDSEHQQQQQQQQQHTLSAAARTLESSISKLRGIFVKLVSNLSGSDAVSSNDEDDPATRESLRNQLAILESHLGSVGSASGDEDDLADLTAFLPGGGGDDNDGDGASGGDYVVNEDGDELVDDGEEGGDYVGYEDEESDGDEGSGHSNSSAAPDKPSDSLELNGAVGDDIRILPEQVIIIGEGSNGQEMGLGTKVDFVLGQNLPGTELHHNDED